MTNCDCPAGYAVCRCKPAPPAVAREALATTPRIRSRRIFPFDVDDTLVIWDAPVEERTVEVICPYEGILFWLKPNPAMIELLKTKSRRGHHIIVWSQSGEEWADAVIKALGIEGYVNQTSDKFNEYGDDLPVQAWAETRVFLKPDSKWRNNK